MFLEIQGTTQSYAWGNVGLKSKVATLSQRNGLKVEEEKPYAELWMGTHPSGPSGKLYSIKLYSIFKLDLFDCLSYWIVAWMVDHQKVEHLQHLQHINKLFTNIF